MLQDVYLTDFMHPAFAYAAKRAGFPGSLKDIKSWERAPLPLDCSTIPVGAILVYEQVCASRQRKFLKIVNDRLCYEVDNDDCFYYVYEGRGVVSFLDSSGIDYYIAFRELSKLRTDSLQMVYGWETPSPKETLVGDCLVI